MNKFSFYLIFCLSFSLVGLVQAQLKVGNNKSTISGNTYFEIETTNGSKVVVRKDSAMMGINNTNPKNKLEITHGTSGNSGLRFTDLNSASTATTSSSKVLGLNSSGDVILTNVPGTQNIVDFSTVTPTTSGVVFTPNTPLDESVVYQSAVDNSMWTYNGTAYVTYTAPASTAWFTAGTTNDAGNSKTSNIYRTGNVGIGATVPATRLHIQGIQATLGANANATMLRMSRPTWSGFKFGSAAQFNLGTYDDGVNPVHSKSRLDLALTNINDETTFSNIMTWLGNGNVGIGTTTPSSRLEVNGSATNTTAFNAAAGTTIDFSRSNLAYTTANAGAFTLTNIKDGGTYTLAVQGTTSGTASFTATTFTFRAINNVATIAGRQTLYTFIVMGTTVYVYMTTGF
jgi:hypothetical protein